MLSVCSDDEITFAVNDWTSEFPPNVMQFLTRAKSQRRKAMHQIQPKLERPPKHKEVAANAVKAMMDALQDNGADIDPAPVEPTPDTSREYYAAHGYTNLDGDYDAWLMSKPHKKDKPIKHYRG